MSFIRNIFKKPKIYAFGNYALRCSSYKHLLSNRISYCVMILCDNLTIWSESKVVHHEKSINEVNYIGIISGLKRAIQLNITSLTIETDNVEIISHLTHFADNDKITYNYYDTTIEIILSKFENVYFRIVNTDTILLCHKLAKQSINMYNELLCIEKQKLINKLDFYEL